MQYSTLFLLLLLSSSSSILSTVSSLTEAEVSFITRRQLASLPLDGELPPNLEKQAPIDPKLSFPNERLKRAYIALHAWKAAFFSDPLQTTDNWVGPDVCSYSGVFCASALDDPNVEVVAGIDLNDADIAGHFPLEFGLLTDLSLLHLNSNRFCGVLPKSFSNLQLLFELDLSNNRFAGPFPDPILSIPSLKFLDIRFNDFEGQLPSSLFAMNLDALFLNNNRFHSSVSETLAKSTVSVLVLANNKLAGCFPTAIATMPNLNEIVFKNNDLAGCLPLDMSSMRNLTVLDISDNKFTGILPKTMSGLECAEAIDISNNMLTGFVPENVCRLPKLVDFAFSGNYFNGEAGPACHPDQRKEIALDDRDNCLPERPNQKSPEECKKVVGKPVECSKSLCGPPRPVVQSQPRPPVARPAPRPVQSQPPVRPPPQPVVQSPPQPPVVQSPPSIVESPPAPVPEEPAPEESSAGTGEGSIYSNQLLLGGSSGGSIFSSVGGDGSASASGSFSASANSHFSASANSGFSASASTTGTGTVSDRW